MIAAIEDFINRLEREAAKRRLAKMVAANRAKIEAQRPRSEAARRGWQTRRGDA